jgi:hypothetical protein
MSSFIADYQADILSQFREQKALADAALARCDDRMFFARLREDGDDHTNSIAILFKHLSGNFRSRWTDFLTTDGEKPDRHREREFVEEGGDGRTTLMQRWEEGWAILFAAIGGLSEEDFSRTVVIRGEPHSVARAIHRNLLHAAHHIGQIDLMATVLA